MPRPSFLYGALTANAWHQASLIALVPVLQQLFQVDLGVIGMLVGAGLALSAVAVPVWGRLVPCWGIAGVLKGILVLAILAVVLLGSAVLLVSLSGGSPLLGFAVFAFGRISYCLSAPAVLPLAQALWAQSEQQSDRLLGAVGRLNAVNGGGRILGNLVVAPLLTAGLGAVTVILAPLPLYGITLARLFLVSGGAGQAKSLPQQKESFVRAVLPRFVAACCVQLSIGIIYILIGPIIQQSEGRSAEESAGLAGICLAVAIGAGLVSHLGLKPLLGKRQGLGQIFAAAVGAGALVWLGSVPAFAQVIVATALLAAAVAALLTINTTQALLDAPQGRAAATTTLSSAQFIGLAVGTAVGGFLGQSSIQVACSIGAVLTLLSGLAMAFMTINRQRSKGQTLEVVNEAPSVHI